MDEDQLMQAAIDLENAMYDAGLGTVWPNDRVHDGWDGATGCEVIGDYMPYPHQWDRGLLWCQVICWIELARGEPRGRLHLAPQHIDPELIPRTIYTRALGGLRS